MIATTDPLGDLAGVGLGELVDVAALLTRVDRKYVVPTADLDLLVGGLDPRTRVLEIDGRRRFGYRSVYFDTAGLDSYRSTAHRRRRRFKIRTRSYLDSDLHVLEVKTRGPRGSTVKQRLPYDGDGHRLDGADQDRLAAVLAPLGIDLGPAALIPVLMTRYHRSTLLLPTAARLTIDTGLVWTLVGRTPAAVTTDRAVVETKSVRGASEADRLLWSLHHRPTAVSKYGTGLAALRPELPAHRWRSVLHHHLIPTAHSESDPR